ncbi:methyltransferase-like protein [Cordyceps javanica]|uniref:Methyltransferase-like protein n=1 Tax=Cordyceps javanica TaxID=43265 RepID=A0A545V9J9_9HYPO|nr:methyltransferase-like protein [Cordyceps javanica]TQW09616.1 methyltransferase-like protein [Cordyceps javanica]
MTQYDVLSDKYNVIDSLPYREMEAQNLFETLKPLLQNKPRVIDFACGTGFYTLKLLEWGAGSVTGVDISEPMLTAAAARLAKTPYAPLASFIAGDGTQPAAAHTADGRAEWYDVALGVWFLNYSDSRASLTAMFRSVALNLKPGGVFVGVVPHPTEDLAGRAEVYRRGSLDRMPPCNVYTEALRSGDGWGLRVRLDEDTEFMTYHLRPRVYEEAARAAGLRGEFTWRREKLLGDDWRAKIPLTGSEWQIREENPHMGILVVWKN